MDFKKILPILFQLICFILSQDLLSKFKQNDYKVKDVRLEVINFDRKVFRFLNLTTFKYNRTTPAINGTWSYLIDMLQKQEILVQGYKFTSNGYRTFPIRFQVGCTKAYNANALGIHGIEKKCGYINSTYFVKDTTYYICNYVMDESKLPPLIPNGIYKFVATVTYLEKEISTLHAYGEIYRPIILPKSKKP